MGLICFPWFDLFKRNVLITTLVLCAVLHASDIIINKLWLLPSSASESSQETDIIKVGSYDKVLLEYTEGVYTSSYHLGFREHSPGDN